MGQLAQAYLRLRVDPSQVAKDVKEGLAEGSAGAEVEGARAGEKYSAGFADAAQKKISKAGAAITKGGALALLGIGVASLKMAADFQTGLESLVTGAGEAQKNLGQISTGVKKIAVTTGSTTADLVKGLYLIESAGFHAGAGLKVLQAASEGARVGQANLQDVADGLTTVLKDYHEPAADAAKVTSALVATVAAGKTHMDLLSAALARVLPTASALHVPFSEIGGDMATMTSHGVSARLAAQGLNSILIALSAPSTKAAKAMASVGLTANKISGDIGAHGLVYTLNLLSDSFLRAAGPDGQLLLATLKGLPPAGQAAARAFLAGKESTTQWSAALKLLDPNQQAQAKNFVKLADSATGLKENYVAAMDAMTGGQRGLSVALQLTGKNAVTAAANTKSVAAAYNQAGSTVRDWGLHQETLNQKLDDLREVGETAAISIGQKLLPPVTSFVEFLGGHIGGVSDFVIALAGITGAVVAIGLSIKAAGVASAVVGFFAGATRAAVGFSDAARTAAAVNKAVVTATTGEDGAITALSAAHARLAIAATGSAASETGFAVAADGAVVQVEALTTAEGIAAVAGAALAAINPLVWVAGAVIGLGALAVAIDREQTGIDGLTTKIEANAGAVGFNLGGYEKLSAELSTTAGRQTVVAQTSQHLGVVGGGLYGQLAKVRAVTTDVGQASSQTNTTLTQFSSRLTVLQGQFGVTQDGAIRLAKAAGVTSQAFTATGARGDAALAAVQKYAGGLTQTQLASYRAATASDRFSQALRTVNSGLLAGQGDLLAWRQAQQQADTAVKASTSGLKGNSAAALAAKAAVLEATNQAISFATHEATLAGGVNKASGTIQQQINWLQKHGDKSKFATQEIDALRTALSRIKSEHADISVGAHGSWTVTKATGKPGIRAAAGWKVTGGIPGVDSVPIMAQRDETVLSVAHSRALAPILAAVGVPGYADGGVVGQYAGNPKGLGTFLINKDADTLKAVEQATAAATASAISAAVSKAKATTYPGGLGRAGLRQIENWWIGAGGPGGGTAHIAAAITGAESGFNPRIVQQGQPYATTGWGLWQITPGDSEPQVGINQQLLNGPTNARAAVAKYRGAGGFSPWTTFEDGAYLQFMASGGKVGGSGKSKADPRLLRELARDVKLRATDVKARTREVTKLNLPIRNLELRLLEGVPKAERPNLEALLRYDRNKLKNYRTAEGKKIAKVTKEIALLRSLTGYPAAKKYGGRGTGGAGGGSGSGDGSGGTGGDGGGTGDTTPAPTPDGPVPAWLLPYITPGSSTGTGSSGLGGGFGGFGGPGTGGPPTIQGGGGVPSIGLDGTSLSMPGGGGLMGGGNVETLLGQLVNSHKILIDLARKNPGQTAAGVYTGINGVARGPRIRPGR